MVCVCKRDEAYKRSDPRERFHLVSSLFSIEESVNPKPSETEASARAANGYRMCSKHHGAVLGLAGAGCEENGCTSTSLRCGVPGVLRPSRMYFSRSVFNSSTSTGFSAYRL